MIKTLGKFLSTFALSATLSTFSAQVSVAETIVAWGDSLTFGSGTQVPDTSAYTVWANAILPNATIINEGLGGQSSTEIAARMGVVPLELELGEADGLSRAVTSYSVDVLRISGQPRGRLKGTFDGERGELTTDPEGNWSLSFETTVPPASAGVFRPDAVDEYGDAPVWIWAGRNNHRQVEQVISDIALMVGDRSPEEYLVLSVMPATSDTPDSLDRIAEINRQLEVIYKERFVNISEMLKRVAENPVLSQPLMTPAEFLSDNIHLNEAGYTHVGTHVALCWMGAC